MTRRRMASWVCDLASRPGEWSRGGVWGTCRGLSPWTADARRWTLETGHRRPAQCRQVVHHQCPDAIRARHRLARSPAPRAIRWMCRFEVETEGVRQKYILIDTAGMRKTRRIDDSIEFFSVKRSEESIARCDIAVLVLDAEAGITEQDKKIADRIVEDRRACIVVVNKWDLIERGRPQGAPGRNRAPRPEATARGPGPATLTTLAGIWRMGAEETVLSRLRAGDLHLGQIGFSPRPLAGGDPLRGRAIATKKCRRRS